MQDRGDIVRELLAKGFADLEQADRDLEELEASPGSPAPLDGVWRTLTALVDSSDVLSFGLLGRVAQAGKRLVVALRDAGRSMDPPATSVLRRVIAAVGEILRSIDATGAADGVAGEAVIDEVRRFLETDSADAPTTPAESSPASSVLPAPPPAPAVEQIPALVGQRAMDGTVPRTASDSSIRVDVDLLDALMRQVGELVLARNQITRLADGTVDVDLVRASQRLSLIASELQEGVMKTRMQPIDDVWSKMPRIVRDLANTCGRQVRLEMAGGDTELDRTLLEAIKDPLTHLVRNAVDHGVESPADRQAAGKPAVGVLALRAHHAGGQVVIEIADDGQGIDPGRVAAKAVERGLCTPEQAAAMGEPELLQMLFLPGFSMAEVVTKVSGRGVGMDVVRTKVEAIGGTVEVDSVVGRGTTWRLRIPLTLAIMPALTVESDGEFYAIPQVSLLELVALDGSKAGTGIEYVNSAAVYRLRGALLPLLALRDMLESGGDREADASTVIAVLQAETERFGLIVDRVLNTEEIVVKALSARLKAIGLYAGATLLSDGRVALILDVQAIAHRGLPGEGLEVDRTAATVVAATLLAKKMLVVGIGGSRRVAIPLEVVTRLERLHHEVVEHVGGREVVQYRGQIVPLVRLDALLGAHDDTQTQDLLVVVYARGERSVAIVVEEILDIVDDDGQHSQIDGTGLVGSTVLKDRVTELLDVRRAVLAADPGFFEDGDPASDVDRDSAASAVTNTVRSMHDALVGVSR